MQILSQVDFTSIPLKNLCLEQVTSVGTGPAGRLYLNVSTGFVECWNGTSTLIMGAPASTLANASTLALRDSSGNLTATTFNGALNGNASTSTVAANAILFSSQNGAYYLSRANHTGTQLSSTISDLTANIRSNSLDQLVIPQATINWNNFQIIYLADPVNPQDAVNKRYVDNNVAFVESNFLSNAVYDPTSSGVVNYAVTATLLAGVSPSFYLNRANHTGTQLSSTISNFTNAVQSVTLDTLAHPAGSVNMAGQKLTVLGSPGIGTDAANKSYVDNSIAAIPPVQWTTIQNVPTLRSAFIALPAPTSTNSLQSESEGYDQYLFYSTSGWRRCTSVPFRTWATAPTTSSSTGSSGQCAYDTNYFYYYGATKWFRIALATWAGGTPFNAFAVTPAGYTYTDTNYFYVAVATNTWLRFAISSSGFNGSATPPVPTQPYYPGYVGMETNDGDGGTWYFCGGQNQWRLATGSASF